MYTLIRLNVNSVMHCSKGNQHRLLLFKITKCTKQATIGCHLAIFLFCEMSWAYVVSVFYKVQMRPVMFPVLC